MGWQWIAMGNIQQISQPEHQYKAAGIRVLGGYIVNSDANVALELRGVMERL